MIVGRQSLYIFYEILLLQIDVGDRCNLKPNILSEQFITTSWASHFKLLTINF